MAEQQTKPNEKERQALQDRTAELEQRARTEGLDLDHQQGRERFEEIVKKAAKPVS